MNQFNITYAADDSLKEYSSTKLAIFLAKFYVALKIRWEGDFRKWNLKKDYFPSWACLWNKPTNIGRRCIIIAKNSHLALVKFKSEPIRVMPENIYRLEDLQFYQLNPKTNEKQRRDSSTRERH